MTYPATTADRVAPVVGGRTLKPGPVGVAAAGLALGAVSLNAAIGWRQAALFLVGGAAGVVLYHAAFGFTSAWRQLIAERRSEGLRAQMLMLAAASLVFIPALGSGHLFGQAVRGSVAPVGVSVAVGAFLFGVGMQIGGGCASGTLYTSGGGNTRMLVTLAAFIAGSVIGIAHLPWWERLPALKPISLVATVGVWAALAVNMALFAIIALAALWIEGRVGVGSGSDQDRITIRWGSDRDRIRIRSVSDPGRIAQVPGHFLRGPWPLVAGALGLAAVNIATLALAGRPWGVTSAFALWGSKALEAAGVQMTSWPYWATPARTAELHASVFKDITSVMDFGIILGAFAAAGLAGRFAPTWRVPARSLTAAVLGGLLLGYGARIAYGCNIGALFSGIASSSVHGWLWFAAAFVGNIFGTRLRPLFGLRVERRVETRA